MRLRGEYSLCPHSLVLVTAKKFNHKGKEGE
jgi:hypothetical protein